MLDIKQICDKIIKEADLNPSEYSVADRVADVNEEYLFLIEKAGQIGSRTPISNAETTTETFTVVEGSNVFTRTIKDVPILRVDFQPNSTGRFETVEEDQSRMVDGWCFCDTKYFANDKQIFVEDGTDGTVRITYARGGVTLFTAADYAAGTPPTPTWLAPVFHPLLWLKPAKTQASYYKKDRAVSLENQYDKLFELFENRYGRDSARDSEFVTDEPSNYR